MERYRVTWVIDIEAKTPEEAAAQALAIQRNPESWATVFEVEDDAGEWVGRFDTLDPDNLLGAE